MRYVCLGYFSEKDWNALPEAQRDEIIGACRSYDDELRKAGHFAGGDALASARTAVTVRYGDGAAVVVDGPYAETKEQIGGILYLEARDLNEAVQLMMRHPGVRVGPFEVRAAADVSHGNLDAP